jgi:hypothetical protein
MVHPLTLTWGGRLPAKEVGWGTREVTDRGIDEGAEGCSKVEGVGDPGEGEPEREGGGRLPATGERDGWSREVTGVVTDGRGWRELSEGGGVWREEADGVGGKMSHLFFQRKPSANLYTCQDQVSCI